MAHEKFEEFEDASYTSLRRELIKSKGSNQQREFLSALRSSSDYSEWVRSRVKTESGEKLPILEENLTEAEFKEPPRSTERQIFEFWKAIPPASACRVTFWGFMTLRHIEEGRIQSSFLAADNKTASCGLERIDRVLRAGSEKEIDDAVRAALLRMGGLPEARGNKSIYVNCPFARAWWRRYVANEVRENTDAVLGDVIKVLGSSQQYWENLIIFVVSRNSIVGDVKVRTALIWALSEFVDEEGKMHLFQAKRLGTILRLIGIRSAWQELGVFPIEELKELMKNWLE